MSRILVDSNVIIYALNVDSSKYGAAQLFLKVKQREICVSHQVINESLRVITHPKYGSPLKIKDAILMVWGVADGVSVVAPTPQTAYIHRILLEKYQCSSNRIFDAYLVATALSHGIASIATDNVKDFKQFEEIGVINPFV